MASIPDRAAVIADSRPSMIISRSSADTEILQSGSAAGAEGSWGMNSQVPSSILVIQLPPPCPLMESRYVAEILRAASGLKRLRSSSIVFWVGNESFLRILFANLAGKGLAWVIITYACCSEGR